MHKLSFKKLNDLKIGPGWLKVDKPSLDHTQKKSNKSCAIFLRNAKWLFCKAKIFNYNNKWS